jgi:hypothetical protein
VSQSETVVYAIDEDGDTNYDTAEYGDYESNGDGEYYCDSCGQTFSSLDMECSASDCECYECCEPDPEDPADAERIVVIRRTSHLPQAPVADAPIEIKRLFVDRSISFIPVTCERVKELYELSDNGDGQFWTTDGFALPVRYVLDEPEPDYATVAALMIESEDEDGAD